MTAASTENVDLPLSTPKPDDLPPDVPADAGIRTKRRWGCAILIALALATPVLLLVGAYVAIVWSSDRLADEAIEKARAAGDPVDVASITAYYPTSPAIEEATAHWLRATQVVGDPGFNATTKGIPLLDGNRTVVGDEILLPGDLPNVTAFLERHRVAIDEAHAARRAGSVARFPIEFGDGIAMLLPNVQNMRSVERLLELDLEVRLAQGDVDGAVEDLLSMIATSESLSNEPVLISQLVRLALLGVATATLERTLARTDLTDEQLACIQEAFARQRLDDGLKRALRGEQFFSIHMMQVDLPFGDDELARSRMLPFRGADLSKTLELWRPVIEASDEGLLETRQASEAMEAQVEATAGSSIDRLRYPMTLMMLPAVDAATRAFLRGEAEARVAEAAIACERYRLATGELPAKLDDLVPEYLAVVPVDPCDRRPLRYVVSESGALLYSVGMDQVDDGGLDDPKDGDVTFALKKEKPTAEIVP